MRLISMTTRDELVTALASRYALGCRADRGRMLDEFAALTGHHRKHAMRLLRAGASGGHAHPRPERRLYDQATREALLVVWEASDRICGKRLRPLVPILVSAMERHGHLQLAPEVLAGLLTMSAATIDRALREARGATGGRPRRRSPPSAAIRRSVAVRTFSDWDDPPPGFMEADLVAHSGPTAKGSYVQTLTLTDIATGWTECAPVLVREQKLLTAVLSEIRKVLPFALLGFDTDNDSVFMNETVRDYCTAADEVDPVWWSLPSLCRRPHRCVALVRLTRLNFVVRWSIWSTPAAIPRTWPGSLSHPRSRSAPGLRSPRARRAAARRRRRSWTCRLPNVTSSAAYAARMSANQAIFPIATMARVLGVSEAGYHAWRKRPPSRKQEADTTLLKHVRTIHASSREDHVPSRGVGTALLSRVGCSIKLPMLAG